VIDGLGAEHRAQLLKCADGLTVSFAVVFVRRTGQLGQKLKITSQGRLMLIQAS